MTVGHAQSLGDGAYGKVSQGMHNSHGVMSDVCFNCAAGFCGRDTGWVAATLWGCDYEKEKGIDVVAGARNPMWHSMTSK